MLFQPVPGKHRIRLNIDWCELNFKLENWVMKTCNCHNQT